MIDQQPSLVGLDGNGACTDLGALPCGSVSLVSAHHVTMMSPELHILTLAYEDIAEGSMAGIAGTAHYHVVAVDFSREENAVTVEGDESILQLDEFLEVVSVSHTDSRAMVTVAPGHIVFAVDLADSGVITVLTFQDLRICSLEFYRFVLDGPVDSVFTSSNKDVHADGTTVATEYADVAILKGNNCAVENAVGAFLLVAADDRVCVITPYRHFLSGGLVLPGHVRQAGANNLSHRYFPPFGCYKVIFILFFEKVKYFCSIL